VACVVTALKNNCTFGNTCKNWCVHPLCKTENLPVKRWTYHPYWSCSWVGLLYFHYSVWNIQEKIYINCLVSV